MRHPTGAQDRVWQPDKLCQLHMILDVHCEGHMGTKSGASHHKRRPVALQGGGASSVETARLEDAEATEEAFTAEKKPQVP